jgi:pimeloyl-ACP methyl ester carboxylesterase
MAALEGVEVMDRRQVLIGAGALALVSGAAWPAFAAFASDRITVTTEGDGPDVVLVHGLSSSRDVWRSLVDKLKGRNRFHLVQIGGYAGAPVGLNGEGPVAAPVAEEIARYITESALVKPAIIGHSMGGTIALMVAARHPDTVGKVMVVDMIPFMGPIYAGPTATSESVRPVADRIRLAMLTSMKADYEKQQAATLDTMVKTKSALPVLLQHAVTSDRGASGNAMHELIVTDLRPELAKVTAPTTVLYVHTPAYQISAEMLDMAYGASYANLKGVKLVRIPDAWHFIMIDQPDRFLQEVTAFLGTAGG